MVLLTVHPEHTFHFLLNQINPLTFSVIYMYLHGGSTYLGPNHRLCMYVFTQALLKFCMKEKKFPKGSMFGTAFSHASSQSLTPLGHPVRVVRMNEGLQKCCCKFPRTFCKLIPWPQNVKNTYAYIHGTHSLVQGMYLQAHYGTCNLWLRGNFS